MVALTSNCSPLANSGMRVPATAHTSSTLIRFLILLTYLRRGILPTFFDRSQRFDHDLCRAVRVEAEFFGIQGILQQIDKKKHLQTFTTEYSVEEKTTMAPSVSGVDPVVVFQAAAEEANIERFFYPSRGTQAIYVCPRNIMGHEGHPESCGRQRKNEKRELEAVGRSCYVERGVVRVLAVTKKTVFHDVEKGLETEIGEKKDPKRKTETEA